MDNEDQELPFSADRAPDYEIARAADRLKQETLLHHLADAVPNALMVLNPQRQIVFANAALARLTHRTKPEDLHGLRQGEALDCIHAYDGEGGCGTTAFCTKCGAMKALKTAQSGCADIQECRISSSNGSYDFRVTATPFNCDGEEYVVFAMEDIAHEKRRRVLERIFFHDILNTAGGLRGAAELLNMNIGDAATMKDMIGRLSQRLVSEIQAQRELAAAEAGELIPKSELCDAQQLCRDLVDLYSKHPVAEKKTVLLESCADPGEFHTDAVLLSRVLGNLVKNALEASRPEETVTLSMKPEPQSILFSVHNVGVMPESARIQVFQRSFSTKGEGRGLGTYSVKLLGETYLGGQVWFTTDVANGTTFHARMPRRAEPPDPERLKTGAREFVSEAKSQLVLCGPETGHHPYGL